jgi:hypothetical protein
MHRLSAKMLGRARRVRIEREHTIVDGAGSKKEIDARISRSDAKSS